MDLISMLNLPAVPSAQIPTPVIADALYLLGQTVGFAVEQQMAPWSVQPPVKSDHLLV